MSMPCNVESAPTEKGRSSSSEGKSRPKLCQRPATHPATRRTHVIPLQLAIQALARSLAPSLPSPVENEESGDVKTSLN